MHAHAIKLIGTLLKCIWKFTSKREQQYQKQIFNRICSSLLNMNYCKILKVTHFILKHSTCIDFIISKHNASRFAIFLEYYKRFDQMNIMINEGSIYIYTFYFYFNSYILVWPHTKLVCQNVILQCIATAFII